MRAPLFLLAVGLVGCSSYSSESISQREILKRSQAEINLREPWSRSAAVFVKNADDYSRSIWKVRAGALDYSAYYPVYKGIYLVPGTERELRFTREGCLIGYDIVGSGCPTAVTTGSTEMLSTPEK
ncbi:MAG: hypothetical protein ABI162_06130 [Luteolibacter sp.]